MDDSILFKRLSKILSVINKEEYPETYEYIWHEIDEDDELVYDDAFDIAFTLNECDPTEVMHPLVASLVTDLYIEEIESGNPAAMTNLGALYYTGRCGEQSYQKAVEYYTMADRHGDRQATENLGYCYYYGRTGEIDYKKAYHYFVKGALDNHLNSLYKIGDMYKNGYYVEKDECEAFRIYTHCYNQMDEVCAKHIGADICLRMGNIYFYGIGTEKNYQLALKYYQEAERYYYDKIYNGDFFSKKGLEDVIEKQNEIRKILFPKLPAFEWASN